MVRMVQAKGAGYALSKQQELETMQHVAHATGMLLLTIRARQWGRQQCTWGVAMPNMIGYCCNLTVLSLASITAYALSDELSSMSSCFSLLYHTMLQ